MEKIRRFSKKAPKKRNKDKPGRSNSYPVLLLPLAMKSDACSGIIDRVTVLEEKSEGYLSIYFGVIEAARQSLPKNQYRYLLLNATIPEYITTIKKVDFKQFTVTVGTSSPVDEPAFTCVANSYQPLPNPLNGPSVEAYVTESTVQFVGSGGSSNWSISFTNIQFDLYY